MKILNTEKFLKKNKSIKTENKANPKRKRKLKPKWLVGGIIIAAVIIFFIFRPNDRMPDNLVSRVDLTELFMSEIEYTISATGIVESNNSHKVYSSQNLRIEDVLVEVGDVVAVGQPLLFLDTRSLEEQIEAKEISMTSAERSAAQQIKTANDTYLAARNAIEGGTNSSLISAEASVRTAYENWQRAVKTYNDFLASKNNGTNSTLVTQDSQVNNANVARDQAQSSLNTARNERDTATNARNQAQILYDGAVTDQNIKQDDFDLDPSDPDLKEALDKAKEVTEKAQEALNAAVALLASRQAAVASAENALEQAKNSYEAALKTRGAAYATADTTLQDYAKNIETTRAAYESALQSQAAANETAQNSLQQNLNSLAAARLSANTDLSDLEYERMLKNLADAEVKANEAGTVTAVFASIGNVASGILFVIEDTQDLVIETTISEFDVGTITVGMPVAIRSEAARNVIYDGTVISVAPTSNKNAQGNTDRMGDTVFATKIKVNEADTNLRIGMSVRLNFIVERQENILAVPYDAVFANENGEECVLVLAPLGNSLGEPAYELRELAVITGLENDLSIVISGEGLREGMTVISTPSNYRGLAGQQVTLTDRIISNDNPNRGVMFGF
ncbi:MAG: HlyD family efflux transporter periplasmic adaptor subunit [Lachnospiraceae bacterium]|nr:HlyD family efflux transporter periplasmic adaptor subunit [Lachnospiraceae bacterium]